MECKKNRNTSFCNCSYPCDKHGMCCECIQYHRKRNELPACYFSDTDERTYDRSISFFVSRNS